MGMFYYIIKYLNQIITLSYYANTFQEDSLEYVDFETFLNDTFISSVLKS